MKTKSVDIIYGPTYQKREEQGKREKERKVHQGIKTKSVDIIYGQSYQK